MRTQLNLVRAFHEKFHAPILDKPSLIPQNRSDHRLQMLVEEVDEYREGVQKGDLKNIAKELADILYVVYGTILEHGLQDKIEAVFEEVHASNMSKDFAQYKMIKGEDYFKADMDNFF